jgi:predicted DCC family thiol-disulfide oxidoreductase YuxK
MIRAWLRNPGETALVAALAVAGIRYPGALAAAGVLFAGLEIAAGIRKLEGPRWWPSLWPRAEGTLTVLYDGTCVLCARSKAKLETWKSAGSIRFLALQSPEARALVPGLDEEAYLGSMHVVENGQVHSAHDGWYRIMRLAPLPLALAATLTPRFLARPFYAWVARNRYRWFGKLCEGGSCRVHPKGPHRPPTSG